MWSGILIVSSKLALMVTEKNPHHELRLARDVFMVTGALSG